MRHSLKFRLFITFGSLILGFVLMIWVFNALLLDKYYYYNKKAGIIESYTKINSSYNGDPEEINLDIEDVQRNRGIFIAILDKDSNIKYTSLPKWKEYANGEPRRNPRHDDPSLPENIIKYRAEELKKTGMIFETRKDERLQSSFLMLTATLKNGDYIYMSTAVMAIEESADTASKFSLFTGIIILIIGSFTIYFASSRITKPVLELNKIAQRMATLDFSKRYPIHTKDEIGQLGGSINSLSEQLEKSIFDLKDANKKLTQDIIKKEKIDDMRKEFVSSVSHELKTPIALIQGYAEGLKVNINEDEENKNYYCDVIIDESLKMNRLVKQLLDLAQIESGQIALEKDEFYIVQLIKQVIKKNELLIKGHKVQVQFDDSIDIMVSADYYKMEQVLLNYLNNAMDYVDDKGIIRVSISKCNNKARVAVFNSGKHIPESSIEKIWISFYKVDKSRTRSLGGTGLGLSIVKAIQDAHNNGYGVKNVEGGIEFWFEIDIGNEEVE